MPKQRNRYTKGQVVGILNSNISLRRISKKINVPHTTIFRWKKALKKDNQLLRKKGSGRKPMTNDRMGRKMGR